MKPSTRRLRLGLSVLVSIAGFVAGAALDSSALALVGALGLIGALFSLDRIPRARD